MRIRPSFQTSTAALVGLACIAAAAGCDDLGKCDDDAARTPVLVGGTLMYAGQAVMVQTCATGCHAAGATGAARLGAPAGLDFDVRPVLASGGLSATGAATVDAAALADLRARQRKVYDQRYAIWEQVESDYMPPEGKGKAFRELSPGTALSLSGGTCTRGEALAPISQGSSQKVLKNWLACKAPVIETQSTELSARTAGTVGDQWPQLSCSSGGSSGDGGTDGGAGDGSVVSDGGAASEGGAGPSFSEVFAVLATHCNACHSIDGSPGQKGFVLAPLETAYTTLLGADGAGGKVASGCASTTKPYVTPGKPEESYLLDKIKLTTGPICGNPMAFAPGLGMSSPADAEVIRAWIAAGAVGP